MPSGYWDIHNHILPGVDDGASCMEETYDLLAGGTRYLRVQGVRNIIFTPHHRPKLFRVSIKDRESVYWKVCRRCMKRSRICIFILAASSMSMTGWRRSWRISAAGWRGPMWYWQSSPPPATSQI